MARYTVETATGTKRETIYAKTRREAAERLSEALADRDKGLVFDAGSTTVGEYVTRWLDDSAKGNLAPRSYHNYRLQLRQHITPLDRAREAFEALPRQRAGALRR
jgi:hypothetical protein